MIEIIEGDIFKSNADVIIHQVNCQGVMGSGVAKQVKDLYPNVFNEYKEKCNNAKLMRYEILGEAEFCKIDEDKYVCNLFGQKNFGYDGKCYSDYNALKIALEKVNQQFKGKKIAIPYLMSCHRGGGDWNMVSDIIEKTLTDCSVTFYKYVGGDI